MKILAVVNNVWPPPVIVTGISILYECQKKLAASGHEVHILTSTGTWDKSSSRSNIDGLYDIKRWHQEQEALHKIKFHTYDLSWLKNWPRIAFYLNRILPLIFIPWLHGKHHFEVIHEYTSTPALIYRSRLLKFLLGTRLFHTLIAEIPTIMGSHYWLNYFTPEIDRIICANKNILKNFQSLGYPPEQLSLVPLGVDAGRFENLPARSLVKKEYGLNHKEHVVLFLGPLENHKGYKVFVEAAIKVLAKNADFLFVLATYDSPDIDLRPYEERKQEITHLIEDFPDNFKIMEGVLNAPELMACADFVAIPQTRIDGATAHPVTLLEAMAAKRVVIASDHRAISELITHGETGYLFGNNNSEDLANILLKVVDNMSLNQQIELNSYNLIKSKYEIETIASSIGILYAE